MLRSAATERAMFTHRFCDLHTQFYPECAVKRRYKTREGRLTLFEEVTVWRKTTKYVSCVITNQYGLCTDD